MPTSTQTTPGRTDPDRDDGGDGRRLVVTLGPEAADVVREMAKEQGVSAPEIVRRGLNLLVMYNGLKEGEKLVIRNEEAGTIEQLRIMWGL